MIADIPCTTHKRNAPRVSGWSLPGDQRHRIHCFGVISKGSVHKHSPALCSVGDLSGWKHAQHFYGKENRRKLGPCVVIHLCSSLRVPKNRMVRKQQHNVCPALVAAPDCHLHVNWYLEDSSFCSLYPNNKAVLRKLPQINYTMDFLKGLSFRNLHFFEK